MEEARINETMAAAREAGMNRRDRKNLQAALRRGDPAATSAVAKGDWRAVGKTSPQVVSAPDWWNEEEYGRWTPGHAAATSAFRDVLGRDPGPNPGGLINWAGVGSYDEMVRLMSLSDEARAKGVDPEEFGNVAIDPETLTGSDRDWYDAWADYNDGPFYDGHRQMLEYVKIIGNVSFYRALQEGLVKQPAGAYVVTPEALDKYNSENGNQIRIFGTGPGTVIVAPEGADIDWHNTTSDVPGWNDEADKYYSELLGGEGAEGGYMVRMTTGNPSSGVEDFVDDSLDDLGIGRDLRNITEIGVGAALGAPFGPAGVLVGATSGAAPFLDETLHIGDDAYFLSDPLNFISGVYHGSEGYRKNEEAAIDLLGHEGARAQGIGRAVATTAATVLTGGAAGAALGVAMSAGQQFNQASAGLRSWNDALVGSAISALSSAATFGATGGLESGIGQAFANAANQGVASTLQGGLTGAKDWDAALEQGAVSALSSLATSGFNAAFRPQTAVSGALQGAGVGAGSAYLTGSLLGLSDEEIEWNALQGAITGGISGYGTGSKYRDYYGKKDPLTGRTPYQTDLNDAAAWYRGEELPLAKDASPWQAAGRWASNWNPGRAQGWSGAVEAWDKATPWETSHENAERMDRYSALLAKKAQDETLEFRGRFNLRGARLPDAWADFLPPEEPGPIKLTLGL